jgi:putative phosphoesterase
VPRIGLLADSHGRDATTRRAIDLLLDHDAQMLVHLGDVETTAVIDALAGVDHEGQPIESHMVFGNCDWNADALGRYARDLGVLVDHPAGRIDLEDGQVIFCHGHNQQIMHQALHQKVRYLCHGHTHVADDSRHGPTRLINPGALHRAAEYSVALLDTDADQLAFYRVSKD